MARVPPRKPSRRRPPGEDAATRVRTLQALDLRLRGWTYRAIAAQLGVSERTSYYDIQHELGRLDAALKEKAERARELEAERLDQLTAALQGGILAGEPRAIVAAVRVMDRRAKLLGLDAPTTITGPQGGAVPIRIVHQQIS